METEVIEQQPSGSESSEQAVIRFEGVSKCFNYTAEPHRTILDSIIATFSRKHSGKKRKLWALKEVSFDVAAGECLGIIGRNGSGKSTILKLVSSIIQPTEGQIQVSGRLSALLELGAGFHQDLTGRENIYLNGSILGMSRDEVEACYDDIVDFSELDSFIDMPVKHYSSGMFMRLGFSVAVHVSPNVLIIDEILAVGDQTFQDKCIERIFELKRMDTTIIIVSHSLDTIRRLSTKLMWLDTGEVRATGPVDQVIAQYLQYLHESETPGIHSGTGGEFRRWGTREIEITSVRLLDSDDNEREIYKTGESLIIEMAYHARSEISDPEFGLAIFRQDGVQVNGPNNRLDGFRIDAVNGPGVIRYRVESLPLLPSTYRITVAIHDGTLPRAYDFHEQAYSFRIVASDSSIQTGLVDIPALWEWSEGDAVTSQDAELVKVAK